MVESEVVLFLDADTLLPKGFDEKIRNVLQRKGIVGGAFEMRFETPDFKLQVLSILNSIRYRIWKTYYGDQAIFCLRDQAHKVGGFPEALMEAAHFCRALSKSGRLVLIKERVITSPRRFVENGFWNVLWFDVRMWIRFVLNLDLKQHRSNYWKTNLQ